MRKVLGDSRAFARANMGRFVVANDGIPLSSLWNELSTMFPSLFDETTSEGDMPIALMDAFERARPEIENPYGSNEEYLMYVSYDILNRVLGLPEAKTYLEAARAKGERRGQRVGRREARAQTAQAVRDFAAMAPRDGHQRIACLFARTCYNEQATVKRLHGGVAPIRKGAMNMSSYEILAIILTFIGLLIAAYQAGRNDRK